MQSGSEVELKDLPEGEVGTIQFEIAPVATGVPIETHSTLAYCNRAVTILNIPLTRQEQLKMAISFMQVAANWMNAALTPDQATTIGLQTIADANARIIKDDDDGK